MDKERSLAWIIIDYKSKKITGFCDVIRSDDIITINGRQVSVAKVVQVGKKCEEASELVGMLEKDLNSASGLLLTHPLALLIIMLDPEAEMGTDQFWEKF